jgi:hypothetical protein
MLELTIIYLLSIAMVAFILVLITDYMLNDSDQERLNREYEYAEKARKHNELMVRKESVPSSLKKENRNGS